MADPFLVSLNIPDRTAAQILELLVKIEMSGKNGFPANQYDEQGVVLVHDLYALLRTSVPGHGVVTAVQDIVRDIIRAKEET